MAERAPAFQELQAELPGLATDAEADYILGEVKEAGSIYDASITPKANYTGGATNYRQYDVINKGLDGNGAVVMATLALAAATTMDDFDEKPMVLTSTLADRNVLPGQILVLRSSSPGTGIADPGGVAKVTLQRASAT